MLPYSAPDDCPDQPQPEIRSPVRQPQYNDTNCGCGYRCGWGCEEPIQEPIEEPMLEEDDGGTSDSETAVDPEDDFIARLEDEDIEIEADEAGLLVPSVLNEERADVVLFLHEWDEFYAFMPILRDHEALSEDLRVEPCTPRDHSTAPSRGGSVGTMSPIPAFDDETRGLPVVQLSRQYFFRQTPLRLSPQYEHCRGDPASHLVVQDRYQSVQSAEETWRGYLPGYGYAISPHLHSS